MRRLHWRAMKRRLVLGLLAALCALPIAACGGGSAAGVGAAEVVPAGVPVYVSLNTDFEGEQIGQARALLERFPGWDGALRMLEAALEEDGEVDFQQDVRPALGPVLDVVVLEVPQDGSEPPVVFLLQPADEAKFDALLAKSPEGEKPVTAEVEGWTAVAQDQETLNQFEELRGGDSLEGSEAFENAMDGLAEDTLVRAYIDVPALTEVASMQSRQELRQFEQLFEVSAVGAAATAEENGFRLDAATRIEREGENFEPQLPGELPTGAIAYVGFGDLATTIRDALNRAGEQNPELDQQIAQLELALGLSLDEDVLPLLEQETAFAVYPAASGSELPSFLLALRVDDEAAAVAIVDRALERTREFSPEVPQPTTTEVGGVEVREVALPDGVTVLYGGLDGTFFATTEAALISELAGDGAKLSGDETYQRAGDNADLPDEVQSIFYVNLNAGADSAFELSEASGNAVPGVVRENVEPLDTLLLYGTQDGDRVQVSGFLALD
jgi:Protein of unknown function (DUF3352)